MEVMDPVPKWFIAVLIIILLPLWPITDSLYSSAVSAGNEEIQILAKFLPFFAVASVICAYFAYRKDKVLSWIIISLMAICCAGSYWWASVVKG